MRQRLHLLKIPVLTAVLALAVVVPATAQEPSPVRPTIPNAVNDPNIPSGGVAVPGAEEGPLVIPGDAPDLIFEFTGRVAGYVEPCG